MSAPLSDARRERVAQNVARVKELMPEIVPEIKALFEAGLIEGWRSVEYIGPHRPPAPGTFNLTQIVTESMSKTKERMKNGTH